MELAQRLAQILEQRRVDGKQSAEHDLLRRLETRQRRLRAAALVGDRVAHLRVGDLFDLGGDEADFAGTERDRRPSASA